MSEADPVIVPNPQPRARKPDWIRVKAPTSVGFAETKALMRRLNLSSSPPSTVTTCPMAARRNS